MQTAFNNLPNWEELVIKYDQPVPRYTSYPTVPFWHNGIDKDQWQQLLVLQHETLPSSEGISLYIHLPFCEALCTYCGCNKKITGNHSVEPEYIEAIKKEWDLCRHLLKRSPVIREIHLGGGTPTFFSPANLNKLVRYILDTGELHPRHEFSVEGHPNNTTPEHLEVLYNLGFRRISFGVQDLDPEVQRVINRHQPLEHVEAATTNARSIGFNSVNYDLIYGLPRQHIEGVMNTIDAVLSLKPDRIAFYSYAHVPSVNKAQRLFSEADIPVGTEKIQLYLAGKKKLRKHGYLDIGMDHFALPHDSLWQARRQGSLNRNFMGYTVQNSPLLIGLGMSAISDTGASYGQNEKSLHTYYQQIKKGELAVKKGYFLSREDIAFRKYIMEVSCQGRAFFEASHLSLLRSVSFPVLERLAADGLVQYSEREIRVTGPGHHFLRNICSAFDLHWQRQQLASPPKMFSSAI